jgi:hypothetical protein
MLYFEDAFYVQGNIQKQIKLFLIQSEINEIGFLFDIYFLYIFMHGWLHNNAMHFSARDFLSNSLKINSCAKSA